VGEDVLMVDALIYVADGLLYEGLDYGDRIEDRLAAAGIRTQRRDLTSARLALPPPGVPVVLTGGQTSVHSTVPWMRTAVALARELLAQRRPVIGICLGSQILAEALRPHSIVSATTIEVGLTPVARPNDPTDHIVPSFHYQAISSSIEEVPGVRIEWGNAHSPVQAFRYGGWAFGCQFHPELTAADMHRVIDYHEHVISERDGDPAAAHLSVNGHRQALSPQLFRTMIIDRLGRQ
jgi:GMP synthase-like glutamine amidotransferase